mmetsp:Transcript_8125/g.22838  ORF Transcript_8125/g.22838 Transcript_8125/m.22838 type:complete len:266 (-) Transcript_8125:485-1282(-)
MLHSTVGLRSAPAINRGLGMSSLLSPRHARPIMGLCVIIVRNKGAPTSPASGATTAAATTNSNTAEPLLNPSCRGRELGKPRAAAEPRANHARATRHPRPLWVGAGMPETGVAGREWSVHAWAMIRHAGATRLLHECEGFQTVETDRGFAPRSALAVRVITQPRCAGSAGPRGFVSRDRWSWPQLLQPGVRLVSHVGRRPVVQTKAEDFQPGGHAHASSAQRTQHGVVGRPGEEVGRRVSQGCTRRDCNAQSVPSSHSNRSVCKV